MYIERLGPEQRLARWRQRVWSAVQTARLAEEFVAAGSDQTHDDSSRLAALGWSALHYHRIEQAQFYFRAALHHDPYAISAWFGLSRTVDSQEERKAYLQNAFDLQFLVTNLERTR
jgi:hypothetical protein